MPIRFRKTIKAAPGVRLNLGKGGMSLSVGAYFVASAYRVLPENLYISNIPLVITEWLKSLDL